jgi:class 3 adenylate cyclase/tetratricopeptide (TPR) repeat protein
VPVSGAGDGLTGADHRELRHATVLVAKIRTPVADDESAVLAQQLLTEGADIMAGAIHRYEGAVLGSADWLVGVFGAPLPLEDHALRACCAALVIRESVQRLSDTARVSYGIDLDVGIVMNSGDVYVAGLPDGRSDVGGPLLADARRLATIAMPGSIRMTRSTRSLAERFIDVRSLGAVPVRGFTQRIELFELVNISPGRFVRRDTRFVGREQELQALTASMKEAQGGHLRVVGVGGDPGIGKSRLFDEFVTSVVTPEWLVLHSVSVSHQKATAFFPIISLLREYFQIESRDEARKITEKLTGKLFTLDTTLLVYLPALLSLLGIEQNDNAWNTLDAPKRRQQTVDALAHLLVRESRVQPICLVFEDLQWVDAETQALLDRLVLSEQPAPILVICNYRPEHSPTWGESPSFLRLRLDPLSPDRVRQLLDSMVGSDDTLHALKNILISRTDGNPFFLEESVRNLVETGVLTGEPGSYRQARAITQLEVPDTVRSLLERRIDRLNATERRLLQAAAVIGKDVALPLLQAVEQLPDDQMRAALGALQAGEFLHVAVLFPEVELSFKHALTHEVASATLLPNQHSDLHARVAVSIEQLYRNRLGELASQLARHCLNGQLWEKAAKYCTEAGRQSLRLLAHPEAEKHLNNALGAIQRLPLSQARREQAIDICIDLRHVLLGLGKFSELLDVLQTAEHSALTIGDKRRLGAVQAFLCSYFSMVGNHQEAAARGVRALEISGPLNDLGITAIANIYLGLTYYAVGNYRRASDFLTDNLSLLKGPALRDHFGMPGLPSVLSRAVLAMCSAERGAFTEGLGTASQALGIAETAGGPYSLISAYIGIAFVHLRQGNFESAIRSLERGLELFQNAGFPVAFAVFRAQWLYALARTGRLTEAMPEFESALQQARATTESSFLAALLLMFLTETTALAGRPVEAQELAMRGLEFARANKERGFEAHMLRVLADLTTPGGADVPTAMEYYRQALRIADELEMLPLLAKCHLGLGTLQIRSAQFEAGRKTLLVAIDRFRDLDMSFWASRAEAELQSLEAQSGTRQADL